MPIDYPTHLLPAPRPVDVSVREEAEFEAYNAALSVAHNIKIGDVAKARACMPAIKRYLQMPWKPT